MKIAPAGSSRASTQEISFPLVHARVPACTGTDIYLQRADTSMLVANFAACQLNSFPARVKGRDTGVGIEGENKEEGVSRKRRERQSQRDESEGIGSGSLRTGRQGRDREHD